MSRKERRQRYVSLPEVAPLVSIITLYTLKKRGERQNCSQARPTEGLQKKQTGFKLRLESNNNASLTKQLTRSQLLR